MRIAIIGAGSVGATCRTSASAAPKRRTEGENDNSAHSLLALGLKWRLLSPAAYRASRRAATMARLLTADAAHVGPQARRSDLDDR